MAKRTLLAVLVVLVVALLGSSTAIGFFQGSAPEQETAWVCPMHPDYTMDATGKCPRCGMRFHGNRTWVKGGLPDACASCDLKLP